MPTVLRSDVFVWVTWLTGLLAGDQQCRWAAWFRAHHQYDKAPSDFNLLKWKGDHTDFLRAIAEDFRSTGWNLSIEGQNKFKLKGERGVLSGQPDLVASRRKSVKVIDGKTGRPRDSDQWQVLIYMAVLRRVTPLLLQGQKLTGEVQYRNGHSVKDIRIDAAMEARIWEAVREAMSDETPPRTPSESECRYCDILDCADRMDVKEPETVSADGLF